ncbi:MAG: TetR family transcriptional regulator [Myxococcales bacterium]|nr:TetR family transcriptional regulator [Myxococcales bacterium]
MARRKEFDPDEALRRARERFHGHGFAQTSMQDLLTDMGIGQGSFYATFGSKEQLFRRALDDFAEAVVGRMVAVLRAGETPREAIAALLGGAVRIYASDPAHRGCFLVNTVIERAPHDPELARLLRQHWERLERALVEVLRQAQEEGQLDEDMEPRAVARMLVAVIHGMAVRSKFDPRAKPLEEIVQTTIDALL